ncbi:RraA family protein [Aspergillus neoniger CBS 115656]|uniref:RraA-like protein n=1 Tax=Aspergillus neoniger (strain CBS 115656) TaxID=1448310 RepID=A0A318Z662_ASPNB|nr:RraA-like protein [Aspergillus neoniger CBS 115656]PYH39230.1 RraA-like protein [Aspergillus neoniger CBS 115656]
MAVRPNVLSALRRFTSCDVGDALVKLGVPQGGYLSGLKMYSPEFMSPTAKFLGPAYTVKMVHVSDKVSPTPKKRGAAGVIIDGKFRDINEHRELGMTLFARGISILGSNSFTRSSELDVPVTYENSENGGQVVINPGDYILGDADGVVVVPPEKAEECVRLCQERFDIDEETRRCLDQGDEIGSTIKRLRK